MSGPMHHELRGANIHVIHAYTYATEDDRLADDQFDAADIGKVCFVEDTAKFYILCSVNPIEWKEITRSVGTSDGINAEVYAVSADGRTVKLVFSSGILVGLQ